MKTRQSYMRAVFAKPVFNARNWDGEKERTNTWRIVDRKTERAIVECRAWMGKSRTASTVYASIWVHGGATVETSGRGSAGGYGYHKESAAVGDAISDAGIELWGSPYGHPVNSESPADTRKRLKERAHIGGCGSGSIECALLAIAHAAGCIDGILV